MKRSEIRENQGATGQIDGREVAIVERGGELLVLENVCTHRRCQTAWNSDERTWDCPCHGSRYTEDGEVINGPAQAPLKTLSYILDGDEIRLA